MRNTKGGTQRVGRNRRARDEGKHEEVYHKELMILNVERTVSKWNKTAAFKVGQSKSNACELCGQDEETEHKWVCSALKETRERADPEIAALSPQRLPAAIKQGIVSAMKVDITKVITIAPKHPTLSRRVYTTIKLRPRAPHPVCVCPEAGGSATTATSFR